ncbi:hypothetical protein [Pseudomonas marginalis]|uniref:hypothetical protein n=1 Tax=Pseudomonas marginalis TaxID=298 RepID=UPI0011B52CAD|nr:hypothetical protein [Pseudomonas marginalis]KAA8552165.1 hypothetical protein FX984_04676 [Pseudomonas marginalis]TWR74115.1 hypothetical protein FIV40_01770 [Pseudomonas marginalis]
MKKLVIPEQLVARITKLAEPAPRRIIFRIKSDSTIDIQHVLGNFKTTVRRVYGEQAYKLAWFNCSDGSHVIAIAGSRPVIAHVPLFLLSNNRLRLFTMGEVLYEGVGSSVFSSTLDKLLEDYSPTLVRHSFGGGQ